MEENSFTVLKSFEATQNSAKTRHTVMALPSPKHTINSVWKVFLHPVLITGLQLDKAVVL